MGNEKISFSPESLRKMQCEEGKRRSIYYDKKQPKLACIVSTTGIKTFALHTFDRTRKKPIQHTIGRYPEIGINHAREIANKLLVQIAEGLDIQEANRVIREEPTVNDLFQDWMIDAKNRIRTWDEAERTFNLHIKPTFGNRKISTISEQQIATWQNNLLKTYRQRRIDGKKVTLSKATANRCLALLRTLFYKKASNIQNPCKKVKAYEESPRERYIKPDELEKFFLALNDEVTSPTLRDLVYLLLLTGARRSNLFSMMWSEIDFSSSVWTIPAAKSKNKKPMSIPLVSKAMEILLRRKEESSSPYVFAGPGKSGHLVEPKRAWYSLIERAGLEDFRLHDLRRTCGSYQATIGANLVTIQKSLGHKNISTTQIYARMDLDPVRKSMEDAANRMLESTNSPKETMDIGEENDQ